MSRGEGRVAVIVVNWNSGPMLKQCLDALERQQRPPERVVLVDNASTDDSLARAQVYDRKDVELLKFEQNLGFAAANNRAVDHVDDCEWVILLNPDAFPEPDWLARMMTAARHHRDFAFFGCRLLQAETHDRLDGTGDMYHVSGLAWRRQHGAAATQAPARNEEIFSPCAAAALYSRDAFLSAGGFDERYFCYFEDVDLGFRLRLAGYRCLFVHDATVSHVGSGTTGSRSKTSVYFGHRNLVWTYVKNMPGVWFWIYLPQHVLMNLVTIVMFMVSGKGKVIARSKWDAVRGLKGMLASRAEIQSKNVVASSEVRRLMAKGLLTPYTRYCAT